MVKLKNEVKFIFIHYITMIHINSRLNYSLLTWGILVSWVESRKIKVLQNACIRILTNGRLRQLMLSMYKAIINIRFVEMVKLS